MTNLITVLVVLFLALFIVVYLLERFGPNVPNPKIEKLARYIIPLMALFLLLQGIRLLFF
jgi:hypothetical protein